MFSVNLPKAATSDHSTQTAPAASDKSAPLEAKSASKDTSTKQQHSSDSDPDAAPQATAAKTPSTTAVINAQLSAAPLHPGSPAPVLTPSVQQVQNAYTNSRISQPAATSAPTQVMNTTELPQTPVVRSQTIDLKVSGADSSQVDVRVSQRAGDVQVTVRTADGDLAQSLRQHLPELSDRLAQTGVHGDIWQPATQSSANTGGNSEAWTSDQSQQQEQQQQRDAEGGQHPDQQQQRSSAWLNELNNAETQGR